MLKEYQKEVFSRYHDIHGRTVDGDLAERRDWFKHYYFVNYRPLLESYNRKSSKVLEIGCGKGLLLHALTNDEFEHVDGIDLSPQDIETAKQLCPQASITCQDILPALSDRNSAYDIIIMKAVLEHVSKDEVIPVLKQISKAIRRDGICLIDVPNMDWIFASHERYMDFTHELGFTQESLMQVLRVAFPNVQVLALDHCMQFSWQQRVKKSLGRFILNQLLSWADPQGANAPIWSRMILGVAKPN